MVMLSVLVIAGRTTTLMVPWATRGALHLDGVLGTGSAMDVQVAPEGLAWLSQLTTKGINKLPPLLPKGPLYAWQLMVTLVMRRTPVPFGPGFPSAGSFIEPLTSPQVSVMPLHGPGSKFRNGGSVVGRIATEQFAAPPLAGVNCGSLPSLEMKMPISQRLGVPELTVTSRSTVISLPPVQDEGPPTTAMPVIETSLAVQPRFEPNRGPAQSVKPYA